MSRKSAVRSALLAVTWIPVMLTATEFVHISQIKGSSMRPTLNPNDGSTDWVLLNLWNPMERLRNDIVLLRSPKDPDVVYCKRVKGLSNDALYLDQQSRNRGDKTKLKLVPNGHLWVEGDNAHSVDSREFGPVSKGLVIGKVVCVIWPPQRWGTDLNRWVGRDILANEGPNKSTSNGH